MSAASKDDVLNPLGKAADDKDAPLSKHSGDLKSSDLASDESGGKPALSTWRNLAILSSMTFCLSFLSGAFASGSLIYVTRLGMSLQWLTNTVIMLLIVGSVLTFAVSYYGDKLVTRFGRRKPFLVVGFVIATFGFFFLSFPQQDPHNYMVLQLWYFMGAALVAIGSTVWTTPVASWIIESSRDNIGTHTHIYMYIRRQTDMLSYVA